jgi:hypothetical protein
MYVSNRIWIFHYSLFIMRIYCIHMHNKNISEWKKFFFFLNSIVRSTIYIILERKKIFFYLNACNLIKFGFYLIFWNRIKKRKEETCNLLSSSVFFSAAGLFLFMLAYFCSLIWIVYVTQKFLSIETNILTKIGLLIFFLSSLHFRFIFINRFTFSGSLFFLVIVFFKEHI